MSELSQFGACPREPWNNGRRRCPHGCGVDCERNTQEQLESGKRISESIKNMTRDDLQWLAGTGRYAQ